MFDEYIVKSRQNYSELALSYEIVRPLDRARSEGTPKREGALFPSFKRLNSRHLSG